MSEAGAFWGMFLGFFGSVFAKCVSVLLQTDLPMYADPFLVGFALSIVGTVTGSWWKKVTPGDLQRYRALHIKPESEKDPVECWKTHRLMWVYMVFGILLGLAFVFAYAIPYARTVYFNF